MSLSDIKVSASILCADFANLAKEIKSTEEAGADMLHVDVMDGHFVPNITIGPILVNAIRPLTKLPIEAHLMIEHPGKYIDAFIEAGTDIVSIHAECYGPRLPACQAWDAFPKEVRSIDVQSAREDISKIKKFGKKAFLVLNPGTPLCINPLLEDLDGVLIMSVNPGFAKQKFMPESLTKIQELRKVFKKSIAVDGGVNDVTGPQAVQTGANILVTASYFYGAKDRKEALRGLKRGEYI